MMRILLLLLLALALKANAQTGSIVRTDSMDKPLPYPVYTYVEQMPQAPYDVNEFLVGMTRYPIQALVDSVEGTVYVQFNVTQIGLLDSIRVIRGVREDLDQAATRTVGLMPAWRPGRKDGRAVAVRMVVPVRFKMPRMVYKEKKEEEKAPLKAGAKSSKKPARNGKAAAKKGK